MGEPRGRASIAYLIEASPGGSPFRKPTSAPKLHVSLVDAMDRKPALRLTTILIAVSAWWSVTAQEFALPSSPNSVKFAAIGDAGTGDPAQYDIANQMTRFHAKFPFDRVIMLGDNIYGGQGRRTSSRSSRSRTRRCSTSASSSTPRSATMTTPPTIDTPCGTWAGRRTTATRRKTSGSSRSTATRSIRRNWPGSRTP